MLQQSLLMSGVGDHLVSVVAAAVASHFGSPIENAHQGVRSDQRQLPAHCRGRNRVVVEIEAYINGLVRFSGHHQVGCQGVGRKGQQLRFFRFEHSRNGARSIAGPGSTVSDLIPPAAGLAIEVGQGSKGAGGKERGANVLDRSFHASFFIPPSHMAGPGGEVVVSGQFQQSGMKANGIAAALQHYAFKVVVKENSGASTPLRKGPHVAAQEVLQRLVKEKLQGQRARIRQRQQQTGEPAGGASDLYCAKRSPVHLPLFADKGAQPQESFPRPGTQGGHQAAQRHYAARVTAGADHLVKAGSAKAWVLLESLADELDIGISYPGPHDLASVEAFGFECPLHRLVVQTQLIGYGCDLPVLGQEESADVAPQLGVDHA